MIPGPRARAAVAVLANRTDRPVTVAALVGARPARPIAIPAGGSRPIFANEPVRVRLADREVALEADAAYQINAAAGGALELERLNLGDGPGRVWKALTPTGLELPGAAVIEVKVMVDDDEVRPRRLWEPTIRRRIEAASAVLDAHAGIRLKVVAVDVWDSNDLQTDFFESLAEFERQVRAAPATVVIGFSSQFLIQKGRYHMGGTRGPLHSHILLKERARNVLETERLELLVHELGHFFGASHSAEPTSVMRPVLGEGLQRRAGAQIQLDPANTLLVSLVGQEIRQRRVKAIDDVTPETRRRLREVYATLEGSVPNDPSASHFSRIVSAAGVRPLVADARKILLEVVRAAKLRQAAIGASGSGAPGLEGDQLLEFYVRQAALAAKQVRAENGPRAMVLALGVALDDTNTLRKAPLAGTVVAHIEGEQERALRLAALGQPTMHGRRDLAKHFFTSSFMVSLAGSGPARAVGLLKEMHDSQGGSGFSFADMAANRAGIVFGGAVLTGRVSLDDVAERFAVADYLPPIEDLQEQLGGAEFAEQFGGLGDDRLTAELRRIEDRILALPVYQRPATPAPSTNSR